MNGNAITISVLFGRRNDRPHRDIFDFADSLEKIAHLPPFDCELMFVINVLIYTATATAEVWTWRLDAVGRRFQDIDKFCFGELLFLADNFGQHHFTLNRERDEDRLAIMAPDALPAESDIFDLQLARIHWLSSAAQVTKSTL